ncbi:MAG: serine-type D-Ala-D-Ala carboxypeptidase, D-alanyl-D-alanine carboxypeptidase (penicillin-binding protein 5/6) [Candidatus Peregrinibacteria bacterium GW2011_GWF2_33_10]|nr:MAG: serine-type D-Ala-D-Ala carboxypeptidase, D-alanyl-D-alanine carboxypeptidase (penicillin-binding protein 5/6) [Candidatus Peregrinibacteria bacterium GW2011_GWF2_33_10]
MLLFLIPTLLSSFEVPANHNFQINPAFQVVTSIVPQKIKKEFKPVINAKSAIAMDLDSHTILYGKNINEAVPFASIVKLMVASLIIEENNLDEIVTIDNASTKIEGSKVYLNAGEKITYRDLLYLMLIPSGNDAAHALAIANSGSSAKFVEKMNYKAKLLGLKNTIFTDPVGLSADQKSSSLDLTNLTAYALQKPLIRNIINHKQITITSENGITRQIKNTNKLLNSYLDVHGVKTGSTDEAGECVISLAKNDQGHEIITVILNSKDRFQESKTLIDWVWHSYIW